MIMVAGDVATQTKIEYGKIARGVAAAIGLDCPVFCLCSPWWQVRSQHIVRSVASVNWI